MNRRLQINDKIGDYRVIGFIGQGGMGEVYHALHEKLGRMAAVKILGGSVGLDQNYKSRFLNEARLQASLHHPNIATLYDFQEVGSELLIFMEFIDGESLESLIERRYFSVEESLKVFESIVSAIAYVHSNGIIHRDIKSENVKLNQVGMPKLLDFGIAKDYQSSNLTQVGGVIGTPNYLAPELLGGQSATVQTDIWSLGVLLYRMLTSRLPFESEVFENLIFQISQAKFLEPETINPAIPKTVSNIAKKCLARDLNNRYQTAEELLADVRQVLNERYSGESLFEKNRTTEVFSFAKVSMYAAPILLLGILFGIGIWAFSGASEKVDTNKNTGKEKLVENLPKNVPPEKKETPKLTQTNLGSSDRTVRIDAVGGSAEVWRNGQKIGTTPLDLSVIEKEIVNLKLKRAGFEDSDVQFEVSGGKKVYTYSLSPK